MKNLSRKDYAYKSPTGKFVSRGKIKSTSTSVPEGMSEQKKRQYQDEALATEAGLRTRYAYKTTLSEPFGGSKRSPTKMVPCKATRKAIAIEDAERRRRRKNSPPPKRTPLPNEIRLQILARDDFKCQYCGTDKGPFHVDHVIPWSVGGDDTSENLVTACQDCNLKKGTQVWVPHRSQMKWANT